MSFKIFINLDYKKSLYKSNIFLKLLFLKNHSCRFDMTFATGDYRHERVKSFILETARTVQTILMISLWQGQF